MNNREIGNFEGFVWMGIGVVICLISWQTNLGSLWQPGSGFMGFISGFFILVVGLIMVFRRRLSKSPPLIGTDSNSTSHISSWSRIIYTVALLLAYAILLNTLGYIITTFLVMWGLFYHRRRGNLFLSCITSLITVVVTYVVFDVWLLVQFPRGIFPWR